MKLIVSSIPSSLFQEVSHALRQTLKIKPHFPCNKALASELQIKEMFRTSRKCLKGRALFLPLLPFWRLHYGRDALVRELYIEGHRSTGEKEWAVIHWQRYKPLHCLSHCYFAFFKCHSLIFLPKQKSFERVNGMVHIICIDNVLLEK